MSLPSEIWPRYQARILARFGGRRVEAPESGVRETLRVFRLVGDLTGIANHQGLGSVRTE